MKMDYFVNVYKILAGGSAMYTTHKLLDGKTDEIVIEDGSMLGAFVIGAVQMAISMAVGVAVAAALTKKF